MLEMIMDAVMEDVFKIILAVISIATAHYILPFVKNDLVPMLKEKRIYSIVKSFVQAAEKLAETGVIEKCDKKKMVIGLLEKKGIVVDNVVDAFIEGCVKELDMLTSVIIEEIIEEENNEETN